MNFKESCSGIDIRTLCGPTQGEMLFNLVKTLPDDAIICEIGAYYGWITTVLSKASEGTSRRILMIDHMLGGICDYAEGIKCQYIEMVDGLIRNGAWDRVIPFPMKSLDALPILNLMNPVISLLWMDGDHNYPVVLRELEEFSRFVSVGGYIVGDDCSTLVPGTFSELWARNDLGLFGGGCPQAVFEFFSGNKNYEVMPNIPNSEFGFKKIQ